MRAWCGDSRSWATTPQADLRLVPEFEHSYSPFRNFPLSKKRSVRWMGWRNLMVAAINAGLEQRLFGLEPSDNWWPGGNPHSQLCKRHVYRFELEDGHTAVASVNAISGDELSINVVLDPRDMRALNPTDLMVCAMATPMHTPGWSAAWARGFRTAERTFPANGRSNLGWLN